MALATGWLGHRGIPQPALVRREYPGPRVDWFDCVLAIWIAEAMLDGRPAGGQQEAPRASANPPSTL